jgi:hypothetical protein
MYQKLTVQIAGVSPLLMHNGQTADPLNHFSKEIKKFTSKRNKTEADYAEIARIEWYASLYIQDGKVVLPSHVLEATLLNGAKKIKMGTQVKAGLFIDEHSPLHFNGDDLSIDEMWEQGNHRLSMGVGMGMSGTVQRTRSIFKNWKTEFTITYDDELLDKDRILEMIKKAGEIVGICDWRPKYGRFRIVN